MPGVHRVGDLRYCGGKTISSNQKSVFINSTTDKWLAVEEDQLNHRNTQVPEQGKLISVYSKRNIFVGIKDGETPPPSGSGTGNVEIKRAIVFGDVAGPDIEGHPFPPTDPLGRSEDVIAYDAEQIGDIKVK